MGTSIIDRFNEKWGDRFDYSDVQYCGYKKKVHIRCREHDEWFWQTPEMHLKFNGCKKCSSKARSSVRSLGKEEFIKRCCELHGDDYDYSKVDYVNNNTKVEVICKKHGSFFAVPHKLMAEKTCCPQCKKEAYVNPRSLTYDQIYGKFRAIYGDEYEYDGTTFTKYTEKMRMICPKHGEFWKTPNKHISGQGCPICSLERQASLATNSNEDFIDAAKKVHGDKYDYSKTHYTKSSEKVTIICHEKDENGVEHGEFIQNAASHLQGCGCPKCAQVARNEKSKKGTEKFIEEAKKAHPLDNYDYSKVEYINNHTEVRIICPIHGEFLQKPNKHLRGHGCPKCAKNGIQLTKEEFVEKANKVHEGKYDYSKTVYKTSHEKVIITCPVHGDFEQEAESHLNGAGCPKCSGLISQSEVNLTNFIKSIIGDSEVVEHDRSILDGKEIDIYIPSYNLGIEYNGLYWHSEANGKGKFFHLEKTQEAKNKGVSLIQIFEDEWINRRKIVESKLRHILHKTDGERKIMARKCNVREISGAESNSFLNENHIQGSAGASVRVGAFEGDELVGVMTFKKFMSNRRLSWELNRFATKNGTICQGVGGKLFSHFVKKYDPSEVKSFADRRWTVNKENNLYTSIGFKLDEVLEPDYRYYDSKTSRIERIHKFNCRKQALMKRLGENNDMSEKEMAEKLSLKKIWDCGLLKYIWKKE